MGILRLTNSDPRFYTLVGPFLSRRGIVDELGFPVWDEDGKEWFVDVRGGKVRGFAAIRREADRTVFCSAWVRPEHRRKGIHRQLVCERLAAVPAGCITTTATEMSRPALAASGFTEVKKKGSYTVMEIHK